RGIGELVPLACFGDVPVLTKPAAKVASGCAEGKHARAWQKMVQRLLLNRIDAEPAAPTVRGQHDSIAHALPNETESALSFVQLAKTRTYPAFDTPIGQHRPPATWIIRLSQLRHHLRNIAQEISKRQARQALQD